MRKTNPPTLARGEYTSFDPVRGITTQTAAARRLLMETARQVCPEFFERLRDDVYPKFARLVRERDRQPDPPFWLDRRPYWEPGWRFETWRIISDRDHALTPDLRVWARSFNADEDWILEGALQTLWLWQKYPNLRESLDIKGFFPPPGGDVVISGEEAEFKFQDRGWQPQLEKWAVWRDRILERFEKELSAHKGKLCTLTEKRGAVRAYSPQGVDSFEWLALYQWKGQTLEQILNRYRMAADKTTIWHGIDKASRLAGIQLRQRSRKLKFR